MPPERLKDHAPHLLRGALIYVFCAVVSVGIQYAVAELLSWFEITYSRGGTIAVVLWGFLMPLFAFYSIFRATIVADKRLAAPYMEDAPSPAAHRFGLIWELAEYRVTLIGFFILCLLAPIAAWLITAQNALFDTSALLTLLGHFALAIGFCPFYVWLALLSHRSARREWDELRHVLYNPTTLGYGRFLSLFMSKWGKLRMIRELLLITLIYPFCTLLFGYILLAVIPFFQMLERYLVGLAVIALVIVALFTLPPCLRGIIKRRQTMRALRLACQKTGYELSRIRAPYLSLFRLPAGYNFILRKGDKQYYIKLLAFLHPTARVWFDEQTHARIRRTFWIFHPSFELFHFDTDIHYAFECDGPRLLLISPVSYHMRLHNEKGPAIDVGDRIGNYIIYNTAGLLGALERNCLGQSFK